jgi:hypothetical protein
MALDFRKGLEPFHFHFSMMSAARANSPDKVAKPSGAPSGKWRTIGTTLNLMLLVKSAEFHQEFIEIVTFVLVQVNLCWT